MCLLPESDGDEQGLSLGRDERRGVLRVKSTEAQGSCEARTWQAQQVRRGPSGGVCVAPTGPVRSRPANGASRPKGSECATWTVSHSQPVGAWGRGSQPGAWLTQGWPEAGSGTRLSPGRSCPTRQPLECAQPDSKHFTFFF